MRLWTLHPKYLDARGLVALWREALLAQAVLGGRTSGYTRHPQLIRFRNSPSPGEAIAAYLQAVHGEAIRRGYCFDETKIASGGGVEPIVVNWGQLEYEWGHLKAKLRVRAPAWFAKQELCSHPEPHPLFHIVPGPMAEWEVIQPRKTVSLPNCGRLAGNHYR
ncbi:MAG: pyrimidine dimer DNA glycosylase/endonuclease V [Syntrophales bacterium]